MKRLIKLSVLALLIAAMAAPVAEAQSRSGSNSRGGNNSRSNSSQSMSSSRGSQSGRSNVQSNTKRQERQPAARPSQPNNKQQASPQQPNRQQQPSARPSQPGKQQQPAARPSQPGKNQPVARPQQPNRPQQPQARPQQPGRPAQPAMRPVGARPTPSPAHRDPIPHGRPSHFWHKGPHYYGYRIAGLPSHHVRHVHWGVPYYVADNVYYRLRNGHYYVSRPPFGVAFNPAIESAAYVACKLAFYSSVLNAYSTVNQNAKLITQQNATIAANNALIAQQNETIALNNQLANESYQLANSLGLVQSYASLSQEYFYDDGVFFCKNSDGSYVTMVPPAGALVRELPEDYEMKVLADGNAYYLVDNTVFRMAVVEGAAYFEVIGQMTQ